MENRFLKTRTWIEIDTTALFHNHQRVKELLPDGVDIMAVVKADAYGHGAIEISSLLADKVDCFGVASAYEAVELRKNGIENDILILGGVEAEHYPTLAEYDVMPAIFDVRSAEALSRSAVGKKAGCYIAVDTGMSRIGFSDNLQGIEQIKTISKLENIEIRGIFSHFACADEENKESALQQLADFKNFTARLDREGIDYGKKTMSNSAAILELDARFDMVREGIILYGVYPSSDVGRSVIDLKPVLSLKTKVELVKTVPAGVGISYGHIYVTDRETRVATLCAGYADGVPRLLSNKGSVLIHGKRAPIIGRVCMDQMMVDVTDIPETEVGDIATVIGCDGDSCISVDEVAQNAGTISYEILCSLSRPRLPRIYL